MLASPSLALALAALIGLSLGVLGSGGSIITLPVLVYIARVPANEAVGMSMAIVGATSLFGALIQWRRGNFSVTAAVIFSAAGMIGSFLGSTGTHLLSKKVLMLLFAAVMLIVGSVMLRRRQMEPATDLHTGRCLLTGFAVGVMTGFLGVGGGFLIVPALILVAGLSPRIAVGTSLGVIAMNSVTGLLGQLRYVSFDWSLLIGFLAVALVGMVAGTTIAHRIDERLLRKLFGSALILLALVLVYINI